MPGEGQKEERQNDKTMGDSAMNRDGSRMQEKSRKMAMGAGSRRRHNSRVRRTAAALFLIPLLTACSSGAASVTTDATEAESASTEATALPSHLESGESVVADGGNYYTDGTIDTGKTIDWAAVKSQTPDAVAWLYVPDTDIDCAISSAESDTGAWLDPGNNASFTDPQTIFHGSTKEGAALSGIMDYGDSQFFSDHPDLYVYTEDGQVMTFRVFASYEEQDQDLLVTYNCYDYDTFQSYVDGIFTMRSMTANIDASMQTDVLNNWQILTIQAKEDGESGQDFLLQATLTATGTAKAGADGQ
jgi:sortase B